MPANSLVHVTIYQYDGDTGLRNPFLSQVQGTIGGTETLDGKTVNAINPEEASHTFVVPQLGVFVPLPGVPEEAKNQCEFAPCERRTAHRTIEFSFRTGAKGRYRWQCFVPCAAGFLVRLRRADADARLHGRVPECRLSAVAAAPGARVPSRNHARRFATDLGLVATRRSRSPLS